MTLMLRLLRCFASSFLLVVAGVACSPGAQAQSAGCSLEQVGSTQRHLLRCGGGISAVIEAGATYTLLDRDRDDRLDAVRLDSKAMLLDVPPDAADGGFEVVAPQAIAAVRGTKWAVDVQAARTSVFVERGSVLVKRRSGAAGVTLGAGDGVDVDGGSGPLTVKKWPAARVSALMSRFGQ